MTAACAKWSRNTDVERGLVAWDVQGHGRQVLEGAVETMRESRPVIARDWHTSEELHSARVLLSEHYKLLELHKNPLMRGRPGAVSLLLPGGLQV